MPGGAAGGAQDAEDAYAMAIAAASNLAKDIKPALARQAATTAADAARKGKAD